MICTIHDLRDRSDLIDPVASAVWAAFWQHKGTPLAALQAGFRRHLAAGALPFTLAAEADGTFAGTVSLIACDEPDYVAVSGRTDMVPWLAALWVEPQHRRAGLGAALVTEIERRAAALGIARLYLSALPPAQVFYEKRGWQAIDRDINADGLGIFARVL
ncbi:GNAT family N-acetyltransferase [Ferrovibrio sp.]|uniref:GNAT family N-acetyltransferase n=1 Tax=Ferrovibrio sp. TaxID=1917215 RepID=UPI0025B93E1D|nr:GNAT family N-acetyltransferase [Ferrovibrio sp.]